MTKAIDCFVPRNDKHDAAVTIKNLFLPLSFRVVLWQKALDQLVFQMDIKAKRFLILSYLS